MSNSDNSCSYNSFCHFSDSPLPTTLLNCNCKLYRKKCNKKLHHFCQISYEQKRGLEDERLNYRCYECSDKYCLAENKKNNKKISDTELYNVGVSLNDVIENENQMLNKLNEVDEIEQATNETTNKTTNETTNKTTNETTNKTNTTTNNSESLVTMVFDHTNQAPIDSPELQRAGPLTTARNKSPKEKKKKALKIKRGCRVKVTRNNLYHILNETQQIGLEKFGNSRNFHGNIISGNGKQGYKIKFDDLTSDDQIVYVKRRNIITVVDENEEEKEYDHENNPLEEEEKEESNNNPQIQSANEFCERDDDDIKNENTFEMKYKDFNTKDEKVLEWKILKDNEYINWGELQFDIQLAEWKKEIAIDADEKNLIDIFFEHFFPCIKGHAKLLDKFHSNRNSPYYHTYKNDQMKFHDQNADDPDWIIKQAYMIMIASVSEVESGVTNLWKRGKSNGRREYPNFGQYMSINYFKCFMAGAPYLFCEEKYWFLDKRDRPWEIFLPCVKNYNEKRKSLIKIVLLMMDESMSGWRPKTSKLGGLPNYTLEPRKPIPLGTMLRNCAECHSGCIVFQDVVQSPEKQSQKNIMMKNH